MPWLAIVLFVGIGGYYESFNITRQILAAMIVFLGMDNIYERKFFKYCIYVIIAGLFHMSAFLTIAFYFVLNWKISLKNILIYLISLILLWGILPLIVRVIQKIFPRYDYDYGMTTGGNLNSLGSPLALLLFSIISYPFIKKGSFEYNSTKNRVLINGLIFYVIFSILALKVSMVSRFISFVRPLALVLTVNLIEKIKDKKTKVVIIVLICVLAALFPVVTFSDTGYNPYYFYWDNKFLN